jgi:branched-chain amino acid aminotransferase
LYTFFNNKFYPSTTPIIPTDSKSFRYGELIFETMRVQNNEVLFWEEHFSRLQKAAQLLYIQFPKLFTAPLLLLHIKATLAKNNLTTARVRLTLFKGNGGLFEDDVDALNILIETYKLPTATYEFNSNGLELCFYDTMLKPIDAYSNFKTGNHLIYAMAAHYAKQQKCNEAIVSNCEGNVADTTISNLFIIKNDIISTPPITDGCVDGIYRKYLLSKINNVQVQTLRKIDVLQADAVFVTNAIKGIQWVKQVDNKKYESKLVESIFATPVFLNK